MNRLIWTPVAAACLAACGSSAAIQNPDSLPSEVSAEIRDRVGAGSRDTSDLIAVLEENGDEGRIIQALRRLAWVGGDDDVPVIAGFAKDRRYGARGHALDALGRISTDRSIATLIELAEDEEVGPRAIGALAESSHPSALQTLLQWATEPPPATSSHPRNGRHNRQHVAIGSLGRTNNPAALPTLQSIADGEDSELREVAISAIGGLRGQEAQAYLRSVASDENRPMNQRVMATNTLRLESFDLLQELATGEAPELSGAALGAVARFSNDIARDFLREMVTDDNRPFDLRSRALQQLGDEGIPLFRELLDHDTALVAAALSSLYGSDKPEAHTFLEELVYSEDHSTQLRTAAAQNIRSVPSLEKWRTLLALAFRSQAHGYYGGYYSGNLSSLRVDEASVALAVELARSGNHQQRVQIVRLLGQAQAPALDAFLEEEANVDRPENFRWAISALSQRGTADAIRALLRVVEDDSVSGRRTHGIRQLARVWYGSTPCCREETLTMLRGVAEEEPNQALRHFVLQRLVETGDVEAVPLAHRIEQEGEVAKAVEYYGMVLQSQRDPRGTRMAREHLLRLAKTEEDPSIRRLATNKLFYVYWGGAFPWTDELLTMLVERADEIAPETGYAQLLNSLPQTHPELLVPFLTRLAEGGDQEASGAAVTALLNRHEEEAHAVVRRVAVMPGHPGRAAAFHWLLSDDPEGALEQAGDLLNQDAMTTTNVLVAVLGDAGAQKVLDWLDEKQAEVAAEEAAAAAAAAAQGGSSGSSPVTITGGHLGHNMYGDPRYGAVQALCSYTEFGDDPWILGRPTMLRAMLSSPAETVRSTALSTLSWRGPGAVLSVYQDALRDPSEQVRMTVIQYIQFPDAESRDEVLTNALDDENEQVRDAALRRIGNESAVGTTLRERVLREFEQAPGRVAGLLWNYRGVGRAWVEEFLDSEAPAAARLEALEAIGYGLSPNRYRQMWSDPAPEFRAFAVRFAYRWRGADAESFLLEAIRDEESAVRLAAIEGLGNSSSPAARRAVRRAMDDDDTAVRAAATLAAARQDPRTLNDIIGRMTNRRLPHRERLEAARTLRTLGPMVTLTPAQQRTYNKLIERDTRPVGPGALSPAP